MPWRSWFQLVFGPTESKRWNGVDTRTEACGHRGDGTHSIHYAAAQDIGIFNPDAQGTVHSHDALEVPILPIVEPAVGPFDTVLKVFTGA